MFVKDLYHVTATEMPQGAQFSDIIKAVNTKWKELPREEKKRYEKAALIDKEQTVGDELVSDFLHWIEHTRVQNIFFITVSSSDY